MISDELVSFETAKLAREKGFNVQTFDWYDYTGNYHKGFIPHELHECPRYKEYYAPTQSLLQRWLREEKGIYIEVYVDWEDSIDYEMIRYSWRVTTIYRVGNHDIGGYYKNESEVYFYTYELSLEDALKYALENLV